MRKIYLLLAVILLFSIAQAQMVTIGNGTSATQSTSTAATSLQSPWNTYYGYSYVQTIYLQSEISASGNITSISYYFTGTSFGSNNMVKVMMGHVARSSFASTTDWEPETNLTTVFDGTLSPTVPGWVTITLTTPFAYNNTQNLVIAIDENTAGDNGTASFRTSTPVGSTNRVIFYRSDATNPSTTTPPTANGRSNVIGNIQINGLTLAGCQPSTGLSIASITSSSATASWTAPAGGSPVTQYNWELRTSGAAGSGATGLTSSGNVNATTLNLTSLDPGTVYNFYIRTDCGSGATTAWSGANQFTTACVAVSSFTQNFDGVTVPALPSCFAKVGTTGTVNTQSSSASSSPNTLYMYSSTTENKAVVSLPLLTNAGAGTNRLKLKARSNFTAGGKLEVGYLTDPLLASSFVVLDSFVLSSITAYTDITVLPGTAPGANQTLALRASATPANSILVDDIVWELVPNCVEPTGLVASSPTTNGVTLTWVAPASGTTPASYELFVSTLSTPPNSATTPTTTGINGVTTTLTTLSSSTLYNAWVRANCGSSTSGWSLVSSFATACTNENVPTANQSFDTTFTPVCWSTSLVSGTTSWAPAVSNDAVPSARTGARFMGKGYNTSDALLISQPINLTSASVAGARVNLWIYRSASNIVSDRIRVHINTASNLTGAVQLLEIFPKITEAPTVTAAGWYNYTAIIPSNFNTSTAAYIIVQGTTSGGFSSYGLGIDDFRVENVPACNEPTMLTTSAITINAATLSWTAPAAGNVPSNYEVFISTNNTAPIATTTPTLTGISGVSTNLSSLTSATTYYAWVRSNCGSSTSSWSNGLSFTTACTNYNTDSLSFVQNFDNVTAPNLPPCFTTETLNAGNSWRITNSSFYPISGAGAMLYLYNSTLAADAWFFTAPLTLTGGTTYALKFRTVGTSSFPEKIEVKYGNAANAAAMTSAAIYSNTNVDGAYSVNQVFTPATTGTYYIGFHAFSDADKNYLLVDSVTVGTNATLPVTLTKFTGERKGTVNQLNWTTSTEINNAGFNIERSVDGINFTKLTFVASKAFNGTSNSPLTYMLTDVIPFIGTNYYRLQQIDKDGKISYSQVVRIASDRVTNFSLQVLYPNPVENILNAVISAPKNDKISLVIMDMVGKILLQTNQQLVAGDNTIQMPVQKLQAGMYVIKAICNDGCETMVKQFIKN